MLNWSDLPWNRIGLHVLFWAVYLPLNALLSDILFGHAGDFDQAYGRALIVEGFSLPVKMALTYFVFYRVIPLYLERSKLSKLVGILVLAFTVTILLYRLVMNYVFLPLFTEGIEPKFWDAKTLLLTAFDCFITVAAACTIKFVRLQYESLEIEQQLVREKLESELSFLRAQTNPHFLFNTLNNLYALARKKSDLTADAIMMLSKIMRFVLYECRAPRIPVESEARVIQDYIALEKLRYNDRLTIDYQEDIDESGVLIAPLMMLPFVENSFKHGAGAMTGAVEIIIHLELKAHQLVFSVKNTIEWDTPPPASSEGIGMPNVQRQLDLLYPGKHHLEAGKQGAYFVVQLEVSLS
jgi:sensor histidine kinase YesM